MDSNNSLEQITQALCSEIGMLVSAQAGSIAAQTTLQSLGMDSLQLVSLLVAIEKRYGINLMSVGLERKDLATPGALAHRLHRCLNS